MRTTKALTLCAALAAATAIPAQTPPFGFPLGARIPHISGKVVDALSGKPVAHIDVTLRAVSDGGEDSLRYENVVTTADGGFQFRTSLESKVANLLSSMQGYWITVNRTFLPESRERGMYDISDPTRKDFSSELAGDPLFNLKHFLPSGQRAGAPLVNNRAYFPMVAQFKRLCRQQWNANCISFSQTQQIRVPLIPVLDHPEQCKDVNDGTVREACRQLNTYRAAFVHRQTIAEVRVDKELCRDVDQGPGTKFCLENLHGYILNRDTDEGRHSLQAELKPPENILIPGPIAGLDLHRSAVNSFDVFLETARFLGCYSAGQSPLESVCTSVFWSGTDEGRRFETDIGKAGPPQAVMIDGNSVMLRDSAKEYTAFWVTGTGAVVRVTFFHNGYWYTNPPTAPQPDFQEATPQVREEFIRQYLAKYPSAH